MALLKGLNGFYTGLPRTDALLKGLNSFVSRITANLLKLAKKKEKHINPYRKWQTWNHLSYWHVEVQIALIKESLQFKVWQQRYIGVVIRIVRQLVALKPFSIEFGF